MKLSKLFLLVAVLVVGFSSSVQAYNLLPVRWPGSHPRVPVFISDSWQAFTNKVPYDGTYAQGQQAAQNAMNQWNNQGNSNAKFVYAGTTQVNQVADDGVNAIIFKNEPCPYGQGCYGNVFFHYNQANNAMHGFDIVLYDRDSQNNRVYWSIKNVPLPWDTDVWSTLAHELGHALGFDHSNFANVVMGTNGLGPGASANRVLAGDDITGLQAMYAQQTLPAISIFNANPQVGQSTDVNLFYPRGANQPYFIFVTLTENPNFFLNGFSPNDSRFMPADLGTFIDPLAAYPIFVGFAGVLDANGQATAQVNIPNWPFLAGFSLHLAPVIWDGSYMTGIEDIGTKATLTIMP